MSVVYIYPTNRLIPLHIQHFNNEKHEIAQYDEHLASYEKSATKVATSLAFLNSGQNVIFSSALTLMMLLAAQGVLNGEVSAHRIAQLVTRYCLCDL